MKYNDKKENNEIVNDDFFSTLTTVYLKFQNGHLKQKHYALKKIMEKYIYI